MEKIALITDSTCDLDKNLIDKYNIKVIPFRIIYKDREYLDGVNIEAQDVYDNLENEVPTTSLPSLLEMEELYDELEAEGYTHVIAVTVSSGLSGMYNALTLVSNDRDRIKSAIIDSKSISLGEGAMILRAAEMREEGKSFDEIVKELPEFRKRIHIFMVMDTLKYLKRGGRIGKVAGTVAEVLNLKPVIGIDDEGVYYTSDKVRGRKQSLKKLVDIASKFDKNGDILLIHGDAEKDMHKIKEDIEKLPNVKSIYCGGNTSPVSGVHSGSGLLGFAYIEEA